VVVPVYNEEPNLPELLRRLLAVMKTAGRPFELIFVNDGSRDASLSLLRSFFEAHPEVVRVVDFNGNYGQHNALAAGFGMANGETVITLDADLQNPPEEIPTLLVKIDEGYDYVGSYRHERNDSLFRRWASRLNNGLRKHMTHIEMRDQGCMLRAFRRPVVEAIVRCGEGTTFLPALAYIFSSRPTEVKVSHSARHRGKSKYNLYRLLRLNFDLITGFTLVPLQMFTILGFVASATSGILAFYMTIRRLYVGPEAQGLFTLFSILFFLISVAITGIGLIGEYVGRMYQATQRRPRYIVRSIWEKK
jgi:undecaprenyl-phosphate 4-deoxy-4-formamido-L-arabinose transferase